MSRILAVALFVSASAWCQSSLETHESIADREPAVRPEAGKKHQSSPGKDVGSGALTIGKSVAGGAYDVAKGTAGAAGNLATGHPINAAASLGTGAGKGGLHAATGTAKGLGKIGKGAGGGLRKLTHL